jgi:hypothetical protein
MGMVAEKWHMKVLKCPQFRTDALQGLRLFGYLSLTSALVLQNTHPKFDYPHHTTVHKGDVFL